jgi:hypothetical protein
VKIVVGSTLSEWPLILLEKKINSFTNLNIDGKA